MNMPLAYRVDETPADAYIENDPFPDGNGVRLDLSEEADSVDVCVFVTELFGVPCSADRRGAWLDLSTSDLTAGQVRKIWADDLARRGNVVPSLDPVQSVEDVRPDHEWRSGAAADIRASGDSRDLPDNPVAGSGLSDPGSVLVREEAESGSAAQGSGLDEAGGSGKANADAAGNV